MDIDQILTQRIGAEDAKKFIIGTIVFGFINFLLLIWHARKRKKSNAPIVHIVECLIITA